MGSSNLHYLFLGVEVLLFIFCYSEVWRLSIFCDKSGLEIVADFELQIVVMF